MSVRRTSMPSNFVLIRGVTETIAPTPITMPRVERTVRIGSARSASRPTVKDRAEVIGMTSDTR
jgi:hypothetical protein